MSKIELRARLEELGVRPSKMLGQNFLLDPNLARAIVDAMAIKEGDHVLEVGPGMGALTQYIISSPAAQITLIERDYRLAAELQRRYGSDRVRVIQADAAKVPLQELYGYGAVKLLGNLPYSASTAIIAHFTSAFSPASRLVLMLQREVAERLVATPGESDYGALTVLLGRRWCVKKLRTVPPDVFWPRPAVESAIVEIGERPSSEVMICDEEKFRQLVRLGFSSRRKQLGSLLKIPTSLWKSLTEKLGCEPTVRAEDLSINDWSLLVQNLHPIAPHRAMECYDVVDENDTVIESQHRDIIHVNKLRHRAVHVWIFNSKGELFLQKRSLWKQNHPALWCSSVAGHVDAGEDYLTAAYREVKEEIGVSVELKPFYRIEASETTGEEFIECFYGFSEGPFTMCPWELETGFFFSQEVIQRWLASHPEEFTPVFGVIHSKGTSFLRNKVPLL
ncbi:MAG: ribosomal RNA small subunit methyltransferase A [Verrucomicrobia bacterium RIFCSPHIGHO2_12_FULL_41_10]|nr:MAG: ribosomal RNA small subunit methyltransferase A [Verrucomicrobia bacterium RIFCSPHIGHO2_12_FULL_41_10]HLB32966.1 16S rRNA (adenine(1518)-N(6)/adenine(1519)-N(6))-dimethyltransferase RsmA [Chthoniobacterales bacterium]